MIASDDAPVASNDKIDRQDEWRRKMKEEAKRSAQNQLRDWVVKITLDDIVLSDNYVCYLKRLYITLCIFLYFRRHVVIDNVDDVAN